MRGVATKEGFIMDAHFHEYLAAVAGMQEVYGEPQDGQPTEFHDTSTTQADRPPTAAVAAQA